ATASECGMDPLKLLLVDDDDAVRLPLGAVLKYLGFLVTSASDVPAALELVSKEQFDVLLADLNIGQPGDGFTVVSAMRRVQPEACTFILTGYPDFESAIEAIRSQVDDYFYKPLKLPDLVAAIHTVHSGKRPASKAAPLRKMSRVLRDLLPQIVERWIGEGIKDAERGALPFHIFQGATPFTH